MITPQEFQASWGQETDPLLRYPESSLNGFPIPFEARQFLILAGLPHGAAPFLSFGPPKSGYLLTVNQQWGIAGELSDFPIIGSNGSGDPIIIDPQGVIWSLNHDAGFSPCYINASIPLLAECLLRYKILIEQSIAANGLDAFLDANIPPAIGQEFIVFLSAKDPNSLNKGCMWQEEVSSWSA